MPTSDRSNRKQNRTHVLCKICQGNGTVHRRNQRLLRTLHIDNGLRMDPEGNRQFLGTVSIKHGAGIYLVFTGCIRTKTSITQNKDIRDTKHLKQ